MTDRTTLLALAERCEQAAGPDKELDFTIDDFMLKHGAETDRIRNPRYVLPYTASLDAAVTLVPEGWDFCISKGWGEECAVCLASANKVTEIISTSTIPALALCAAALRAKAMTQPSSDR
jgi:hypothetical protein